MVATVQISPTEGAADLDDDIVRTTEDVGGGEPQHRPPGGDQPVLPAQVVDEHVPPAVEVAVELDEDPLLRPGEVGAAEEGTSAVPDDGLQLRREAAGPAGGAARAQEGPSASPDDVLQLRRGEAGLVEERAQHRLHR